MILILLWGGDGEMNQPVISFLHNLGWGLVFFCLFFNLEQCLEGVPSVDSHQRCLS